MQYRIRRARTSDLNSILRIERASFGRDAYDRALFADYLHKCGAVFLLAEGPQGGGAGYLIICIRVAGGVIRAELVSIAVAPAARGCGLASALLNAGLRRLARRQVVRLNLVVRVSNLAARAMYRKYGFRIMRRIPRYYEDGETGIAMARDLRGKL